MKKAILGILVAGMAAIAAPASAAEGPITYDKLARCNFPENMIMLILKHESVLTDTEKEFLALKDAGTRVKWVGDRGRKAALSFYCGKFKKELTRFEAAERLDP